MYNIEVTSLRNTGAYEAYVLFNGPEGMVRVRILFGQAWRVSRWNMADRPRVLATSWE